uniref:Reverse transcriptase domain-containing protein n=1 Tax=Tanacetum cinerariifolium TaxID=118510 RepID=A0A6L2NSH7_TANCI|nr:hypothetical protein [Tanacetum cinerariifolium]
MFVLWALYTKSCDYSKGGFVDKFVHDPNKTSDSSQQRPHDCLKCGNPVDGLHCRQCALLRKKWKEVWFIICDEQKIFQNFLNTSELSNDNTNAVNAPQEPLVFNQDPGENSSQSPPHIDHHCCYGCGDSLDDENSFAYDSTPNFIDDSINVFNSPLQSPMYSYVFCGNEAHFSHDCPPQVPFIYNLESCYNQDLNFPQNFQVFNNNILVVKAVGARMKLFNIPIYYDDDDDEESSTPLRDIIISELPPCIAITPVLSTEEPNDTLIMGDEYLDTILEKESDEFIKSSVENLVPNPSEFEGLSNIRRECDVLVCDDFTTLYNLLFDADDDFSSSDDKSFFDEDVSKKIYSNPLFNEEIISIKIDPHHLNAESDLIESLLNQDSLIISSSKIDYEEIRLIEKLLYDNSSPHPPKEINFENFDAVTESFSPYPIPIEDSDPFIKETDLFLTSDGSIPPGVDSDYSDSEADNLFPERLLHDDLFPFRTFLTSQMSFEFFFPSLLIW